LGSLAGLSKMAVVYFWKAASFIRF